MIKLAILLLVSSSVLASEELPYIYQGKPIQPHVFKEFVPWLSETNSSPTVTIDLANLLSQHQHEDTYS